MLLVVDIQTVVIRFSFIEAIKDVSQHLSHIRQDMFAALNEEMKLNTEKYKVIKTRSQVVSSLKQQEETEDSLQGRCAARWEGAGYGFEGNKRDESARGSGWHL